MIGIEIKRDEGIFLPAMYAGDAKLSILHLKIHHWKSFYFADSRKISEGADEWKIKQKENYQWLRWRLFRLYSYFESNRFLYFCTKIRHENFSIDLMCTNYFVSYL